MIRREWQAVAVAGAVLLAACGGGAGSGTVGGGDAGAGTSATIVGLDTMKFNPEAITVKAGVPVKITFKNGGMLPHDLVTEGGTQNAKLVNIGAGKEQAGTFMAPKPGTYAIVCTQPGHKEAGMVAKITVE